MMFLGAGIGAWFAGWGAIPGALIGGLAGDIGGGQIAAWRFDAATHLSPEQTEELYQWHSSIREEEDQELPVNFP